MNVFMKRAAVIAAAVSFAFAAGVFAEEAVYLKAVPEGFTAKAPVSFYNKSNLYEYIDGQAVFYNSYGFTRLEHGTYQKGSGVYTVDIYELGGPLSSFGAFRQQREEDARAFPAGVEGAIIDYLAVFYKDKFYVEVIPQSSGDDDSSAMEALSLWVDGLLPGEKSLPPELSIFPKESLVPMSERFVDESLISYSFMGKGLSATYKIPGEEKELKVFLALTPGPDQAKEIFKGFQDKMTDVQPFAVAGTEGAKGQLPYRGLSSAFITGPYVFGAMSIGDEKKAAAVLAVIAANLKKRQ